MDLELPSPVGSDESVRLDGAELPSPVDGQCDDEVFLPSDIDEDEEEVELPREVDFRCCAKECTRRCAGG